MTANNREPKKSPVIHTPSRREFLAKGALIVGGTMLFGLPFLTGRTRPAYAAAQNQGAQPGRYALVLGGQIVGLLNSVNSGFVSGAVVRAQLGSDQNVKKHLAAITYEDISITCGGNMSPQFYQWIQESMSNQINDMNGTILKTDMNYQVIDEKVFQNAIITEIGIPALDTASNEPYVFNVTFKPQQTIFQPGSGSQIPSTPQTSGGNLLASNFRLNIQGLESACAYVHTIEPLVWKRTLAQTQMGTSQQQNVGPQSAEVPNLVITLPESQATPFSQWFYNFVIQGQADDSAEKPGLLELMAPDQQQVLFSISFGHLGIFRMSPVAGPANAPSMVKVEMYCETMHFSQGQMGSSSSQQQSSAPSSTPPTPSPRRRRAPSRRKKSSIRRK